MEKQAETLQYTIRGIPPEVDRMLRAKASKLRQSLNQVVVDELTAATTGRKHYADFSDLVGKWIEDPEFDETIAEQRKIDWDKWK